MTDLTATRLTAAQQALLTHPQLPALLAQLDSTKLNEAAAKRAALIAELEPIDRELEGLLDKAHSAPSAHANGIRAGAPPAGTREYYEQRRFTLLESSRDLRARLRALDGGGEVFCPNDALLNAWRAVPKTPEQQAADALPPLPPREPERPKLSDWGIA
jgi:nitroreductase